MGFIDFDGSSVVHSVGGWCAFAGLVVLGPRLGGFGEDVEVRENGGHNLPLVAFGGMILWFGWFGFNGGSTLAADGTIGGIILNTHLAGAAGVVGFVLTKVIFLDGKLLMTDTVNGGLAGLVSITAGCATMSPTYAVLTGLTVGLICVVASAACINMKWDDAVGAVAVHGVCGAWGTLAAGLFFKGALRCLPYLELTTSFTKSSMLHSFGFAESSVLFSLTRSCCMRSRKRNSFPKLSTFHHAISCRTVASARVASKVTQVTFGVVRRGLVGYSMATNFTETLWRCDAFGTH